MIQLACLLDGGLCVLAVCGGGFVLSALGFKMTQGKNEQETAHTHDDCRGCDEQTESRS